MASLNEILFGAPQYPTTQANPEMMPVQAEMPQSFDPAAVEKMQQPSPQMADAVQPKGNAKGSWEDPNRWLITAAALAAGPRGLQMLPLAHMAYSELTGAQARESENVQREQQRREQDTGSLVEARGAQTEATRQSTQESKDMAPTKLDRAKAEAKLKQYEVELEDALARNDPGAAKRAQLKLDAMDLQLKGKKADIKQSEASAAASFASAANTGEMAKARKTLNDPKATQEEKDAAQLVVGGGKGATAEARDRSKFIEERLKRANPKMTDQELAQAVLDYEGTRKGQQLDALKYLAENATGPKKKEYEAEIEKLVKGKPSTTSSQTQPNADAWTKARNSVKPGQQYVGPDGNTYTRGN